MPTTIKLTAESSYGCSGQYIARITGRAERVQFARSFVGTKYGKRGEYTSYETDEIGLYEVQSQKKGKSRSYWLVLECDGELRRFSSDHEDALAIAKRLDSGESLPDIVLIELGDVLTNTDGSPYRLKADGIPMRKAVYSIRSKSEAKAAVAAATLDSAVSAIVAALMPLPELLRRKALTAAKEKIMPKKESVAAADAAAADLI